MTEPAQREPRWPGLVAMVATGCIYMALPEPISAGPAWLLLAVVFVLLIPIVFTYRAGRDNVAHNLAFVANGVITLALILSLGFLIQGLPHHRESPSMLLRSAGGLWVTNILVFALWYWKLDAGGPLGRESSKGQLNSSFLFPQMMRPSDTSKRWSPQFMDYLFLAFNTSTAFSPTDTAVLSRWAKLGTMLQALISLSIIALLASRAVNIL